MATVYRATAPNGNLVALKVLALHLAADPTARLRFEQESRLGLVHPNIVRVLDCGVIKGAPFIAMEYVVGESLDRRLTRLGTLLPQQLAPIIRDAARALDYAHERGIIHRDVKPSNILIRTNGQALLADFGVAKSASMTAYTATAARVGSVFYMSPEQANGALEITPASDIYSLGVTAYYALAGRHPFEGDNEIAIARMHIDVKPRHISEVNPGVPRNVGAVIMQALEKDPLRRPATAGELARALQQATRESGRGRRPIRRFGPTLLIAAATLCVVPIVVFAATRVLPGAGPGVTPTATVSVSPSPATAPAGGFTVLSATISSPAVSDPPTLTLVPTGDTPSPQPTAEPKQVPTAVVIRKTARPSATPTRRPAPTRTRTPVPTAAGTTPVVMTSPTIGASITPIIATDLPPTSMPPTDVPPTAEPPTQAPPTQPPPTEPPPTQAPPTQEPPTSAPSSTTAPATAAPVNVPPAATSTTMATVAGGAP